jgi:hypothetical protein
MEEGKKDVTNWQGAPNKERKMSETIEPPKVISNWGG